MPNVDNSLTDTPKGQSVLKWLRDRGLSEEVIGKAGLKWNKTHVVIPVRDTDGNVLFNKYRRDPERSIGPKYTYDTGAKTALYNRVHLLASDKVVICEGELDALLLDSKGFTGVSSTGGAGTFLPEWAAMFEKKEVWVVLDNDDAGMKGSIKICRLIPHAKLVRLPSFVGEHGDITDYFKERSAEDFRWLLVSGLPLPPEEPKPLPRASKNKVSGTRLAKAKAFPLYVLLGVQKKVGFVRCPIHQERTGSFKIYADNRWYCFGCGKGGDTIDFVMLRDGSTMSEAMKTILELR